MAMIENETRIREGTCPEHGKVQGVKELPAIKFPFLITAPARGLAALRPYRCPACGAKVS
jgi:hypothetical protein